jgi:hypothetical protein
MASFAGDSQIRTGSTTGTVRFWNPTLEPLQGDVERIALWIHVRTGLELDSQGSLNSLDAETWQQRRNRLLELGGAQTES